MLLLNISYGKYKLNDMKKFENFKTDKKRKDFSKVLDTLYSLNSPLQLDSAKKMLNLYKQKYEPSFIDGYDAEYDYLKTLYYDKEFQLKYPKEWERYNKNLQK